MNLSAFSRTALKTVLFAFRPQGWQCLIITSFMGTIDIATLLPARLLLVALAAAVVVSAWVSTFEGGGIKLGESRWCKMLFHNEKLLKCSVRGSRYIFEYMFDSWHVWRCHGFLFVIKHLAVQLMKINRKKWIDNRLPLTSKCLNILLLQNWWNDLTPGIASPICCCFEHEALSFKNSKFSSAILLFHAIKLRSTK